MKLVITTPDNNQTTDAPEITKAEHKAGLLGRVDLRNLGIVLFGFVFVLILVPPVRTFPMDDDWAYSQSVADLLHWSYKPHDWTQPTALGHLAWGALFSSIFGYNFTTLSIATLTMSAICLVVFYLLLRRLDVGPTQAFLGTVLLGCNPIYVYLSYSFMTDVTFLTYMLAACLCYVLGAQNYGHRYSQYWFWLGGVATALAYLTRQVGVFVALAALIYLWWSRRWSWQSAIAISAIPVAVTVSYMLWESTQPTRFVAAYLDTLKAFALSRPIDYAIIESHVIATSLATPGLCLLSVFWRPRRPILAVPLLAYLLVFQILYFRASGTMFPAMGNVVAYTGFAMGFAIATPLWNTWVWVALGVGGVLVLSFYIATCGEWAWSWLGAGAHKRQNWRMWLRQRRSDNPVVILYALGLLLAVITFVVSPAHFDRYMLPLLPMLMLPSLQRMSIGNGREPRVWRWLVIVPIALFSVVGMRDYIVHASLRWQGAEQLVAQGARHNQVDAGFEWMGEYMFKDGVQYIRQTHDMSYAEQPAFAVLDPVYVISDRPVKGYTQIGALPYQSWLEGGRTQYVLSLKRK